MARAKLVSLTRVRVVSDNRNSVLWPDGNRPGQRPGTLCRITAIPFYGPTAGLATLCGVKRCGGASERPRKRRPDAGKRANLGSINDCDITASLAASVPGTPRHHRHARRQRHENKLPNKRNNDYPRGAKPIEGEDTFRDVAPACSRLSISLSTHRIACKGALNWRNPSLLTQKPGDTCLHQIPIA